MKVLPAALLLLAAVAVLALSSAAPAAAQATPNSNNAVSWVKGPVCVPGTNQGYCCCAKRAKTVINTKYTTKTAIKTIKRTKTVTKTVTTTFLNRRLLDRNVAPEIAEREVPEAVEEEAAPEADVEMVERAEPVEPEVAATEGVEEGFSEVPGHELFARNLCQACPTGVNPRLGANNNGNAKRCCPRSTKFVTRTKTTTKAKTTTVKTATRTVTRTVTQSAAASIPVFAFYDANNNGKYEPPADYPLRNTLVSVTSATGFRLAARQQVVGTCTTNNEGRCTILIQEKLTPGEVYIVTIPGQSGKLVFTATPEGTPPPSTNPDGTYDVSTTETTTIRIGRRELHARREADGLFRRALKARATPHPHAY